MKTLGAKDLTKRIDEILLMVKQGETVEIVEEGKVVARFMPPEENQEQARKDGEAFLATLDRIAKEVSAHITEPIDAVEIVREGRRGY